MKQHGNAVFFGCLAVALLFAALASAGADFPIGVSLLILLLAVICGHAIGWSYDKPEARKPNEKRTVEEHDLLEIEMRRAFENMRN